MQGYKPVFDKAESLAEGFTDYEHFRDYPDLFHFIIAPPHLLSPDEDSLAKAKLLSPDIYTSLTDKGPSYGSQLDAVESRHILMMSYLASKIGSDWGSVLEIGGGYGNWARLASGVIHYNRWSIMDIPHVTRLQKYLLADIPNITFNEAHAPVHVAIGAHSMSEFSMKDFTMYLLIALSLGTEYFLYVAHDSTPDPLLLYNKLSMISLTFDLIDSYKYEGNYCTMYLGQRRTAYYANS